MDWTLRWNVVSLEGVLTSWNTSEVMFPGTPALVSLWAHNTELDIGPDPPGSFEHKVHFWFSDHLVHPPTRNKSACSSTHSCNGRARSALSSRVQRTQATVLIGLLARLPAQPPTPFISNMALSNDLIFIQSLLHYYTYSCPMGYYPQGNLFLLEGGTDNRTDELLGFKRSSRYTLQNSLISALTWNSKTTRKCL
jgi:hypothetical protein